jgi:hypothetical protein
MAQIDAQPEAPGQQEALGLTEVAEVSTCRNLVMGTGSRSYLHSGTDFTALCQDFGSITLAPGKF